MARILVVDDEPDLRNDFEWAVSGLGEVATAGSAKEAIQRIAEETFDVVVTDLRMETREAGLEGSQSCQRKRCLHASYRCHGLWHPGGERDDNAFRSL